jgi:hypothetical protein
MADAEKNILWFMPWFEKEVKRKLSKQIEWLKARVKLSPEEEEFWQLLDETANELHDAGYFIAAKMVKPRVEGKPHLE